MTEHFVSSVPRDPLATQSPFAKSRARQGAVRSTGRPRSFGAFLRCDFALRYGSNGCSCALPRRD
ncbi:MAG: hypothetical protein JSS30_07395 [Verrucomicrobia bacterium]|nr:hypothetical protein [Verrucomicrobiota bacterium]